MNMFGQRLKKLRTEHHLTQEQLGNSINVTKVSICCYEKGTRLPSLETLVDISEVFQVSIDYLLGNDYMVIAEEDDVEYGVNLSKEEIKFLKEIRKFNHLYERVLTDPKRFVELINKKLK